MNYMLFEYKLVMILRVVSAVYPMYEFLIGERWVSLKTDTS